MWVAGFFSRKEKHAQEKAGERGRPSTAACAVAAWERNVSAYLTDALA
jgi:hypothetical protein